MNSVIDAYYFAKILHNKQKRKYTKAPYFNHCESVMKIVSMVDHDDNMLCASLLHDVVEDTKCTNDIIKDSFGFDVAYLVAGLTDLSTLENRKERKQQDLERISHYGDRVKTIKLADIIDNTSDIIFYDSEFAKTYIAEKKLMLDVLVGGDCHLHDRVKQTIDEYYKTN